MHVILKNKTKQKESDLYLTLVCSNKLHVPNLVGQKQVKALHSCLQAPTGTSTSGTGPERGSRRDTKWTWPSSPPAPGPARPWPHLGWVTAGQHRVIGCSKQASYCSSRKCARVLSIVHCHSDSYSLIYAHAYEHRRFSEIRPRKCSVFLSQSWRVCRIIIKRSIAINGSCRCTS